MVERKNEYKIKNNKVSNYFVNLDTFEKICMYSHAKKANSVRDYFILLRKFIDYYHNDIGDSIKKKMHMNPNKCVYILLINESKKIYKFGRSSDLRKRLRNYATCIEKHPDIKFIMIVENPMLVEKCVKELISNFQFKERQEKYQVTHDLIKKVIFECAELHDNFKKLTYPILKMLILSLMIMTMKLM